MTFKLNDTSNFIKSMDEAAGLVFGAHGGYVENGKILAIDLHSQGVNRNDLN